MTGPKPKTLVGNLAISINIFLICLFSYESTKSNDFPTLARSEFVFACMSSNANNRDFMAKCSCAIDEIAKRMTFKAVSYTHLTLPTKRIV